MFCIRCGREIPGGSTFCTFCGQRQDGSEPSPEGSRPDASVPAEETGLSPVQPEKRRASRGKSAAIVAVAVAVVLVAAVGGGLLYVGMSGGRGLGSAVRPSSEKFTMDLDADSPAAEGDVSDDEESLREDVATTFDGLMDPGSPLHRSYVESFAEGAEGLSEYGIDAEELATVLLEDLDYEIGDVVVDESSGTGTVHVTVECKSLADIMAAADETYAEASDDPEVQGMSEEQAVELIGEVFVDKAKKAPVRAVDLEFDYTRDAETGLWNLDASAAGELYDMFFE